MELKIGRNTFDVNENDLLLDNGSCFQLITKGIYRDNGYYPPKLSKELAKKLKELDAIYTNEDLKLAAEEKYRATGVTYWKFNIEKMKQLSEQKNI